MATLITTDRLLQRLTRPDPPVIVEALGAAFYADAHLPGAINIPPGQVDQVASALLPDPAADIVVYCTSSGSSSNAVARRLEDLGYRSVAVYEGGKEEWVENGLPLERSGASDSARPPRPRPPGV